MPQSRVYWEGRSPASARPSPHLDLRAQCLPPRRARPLHRRHPCALRAPMASNLRELLGARTLEEQRQLLRDDAGAAVRQAGGALGHRQPPVALRPRHSARAVRGAGRRQRHARTCCARGSNGWPAASASTTTTSPGRPSAAPTPPMRSGPLPPYLRREHFDDGARARRPRRGAEPLDHRISRRLPRRLARPLRAARRAGLDDRCAAQRAVERDHPHRPARRARDLPHRRRAVAAARPRRRRAARPLALRGRRNRSALTARDRSAIYGGFHLYVLEG